MTLADRLALLATAAATLPTAYETAGAEGVRAVTLVALARERAA